VEAARANKPDAIILDIVMADMDGFATLRALRACGVSCPVIAYTSRRERRDGEFKTRGFDAYVPKSESLSGLMALLRILIGRFSRTTTSKASAALSEAASNDPASHHMPLLRSRHVGVTSAN
jgi:two-component system OmpR family response regulator